MKTQMTHWVTVTILLFPALARPCGPDFPTAFVWRDTGDLLLTMPETHFYSELEFHYGRDVDTPPPNDPDDSGSILDIEVGQLLEALAATTTDKDRRQDLAEAYRAVRTVTRSLGHDVRPRKLSDGPVRPSAAGNSAPHESTKASFRFDIYAPLFHQLPEEFGYYAEGATYYHQDDFERATTTWKALLDLPREQRHYRSVWAAYMLGTTLLNSDTAAAIPYFEQTRQWANDGLPDPLDLRRASLGWQAHAEALLGDYQASIQHYVEQFRVGTSDQRASAHLSLDFVCGALMRSGPPPAAIRDDPLCRDVITLWVLSGRASASATRQWTDILMASPPQQPIAAAGQLAHLYYQAGEMELASQWTELADPDDLAAAWVRSKLLLRAGKQTEAEAILAKLTQALKADDLAGPTYVSRNDAGENRPLSQELGNELGTLRLNADDYTGALEAFLATGSVADATYIADQVLTADELESFLTAHPGAFDTLPQGVQDDWLSLSPAELLQYILARKLTRQGDFDRARPYFPEVLSDHLYTPREEPVRLRELLDSYAAATRRAEDTKQPKTTQAEGYFELAMITRTWGLELLGTEQAPDWRMFDGVYTPYGETRPQAGTATPAEAVRVAANAPDPNQRFHYRTIAADRMWRAAELLPDNDEKTAQALWYGGTWIADTSPGDADKFYKALVRRCRQLPIGQAADAKRWFPEKPKEWP